MRHYNEETGEYIEKEFKHLDLPDDLDNPVIDGVHRTMNLAINRASGWHYDKEEMLFVPAYREVKGQSLTFRIKATSQGIVFSLSKSRSFNETIKLADVFAAVFNISDPDQIRAMIGINSPLLTDKKLVTGNAGEPRLSRAIRHKNLKEGISVTNKFRTIMTRQTLMSLPQRLYSMLSLNHFVGCTIAEDVVIQGLTIPKFSILDEKTAFIIQHSGLDSVKLMDKKGALMHVTILNQLYVRLKHDEVSQEDMPRFSDMEASQNNFTFKGTRYEKAGAPLNNTLEVYCIIINRMIAFQRVDVSISMQDFENQTIQTIHDHIDNFIRDDLEGVYERMETMSNYLVAVSERRFDRSRLNNYIKDNNSAVAVISKNENPLAQTSQGQTLVRDVVHLPKEALHVMKQDLGVIDPVDTTESKNIAKTTPLTMTTKKDAHGNLLIPLYPVVDGVVSNRAVDIPVGETEHLFIAEAGAVLEGNVLGRHKGLTRLFSADLITHVRVSPFSSTSYCRGSSAFMENTDQKRAQMTANAQRQARTILRPKRAALEVGVESIVAHGHSGYKHIYTVREIFEDNGVSLEGYESERFEVRKISQYELTGKYEIRSVGDKPSLFALFDLTIDTTANHSQYYYELVSPKHDNRLYYIDEIVYRQHNIVLGGKVKGTDRLNYHTKGDEEFFNTSVANGIDLFVMVGFSGSFTTDDASIMSDRVVRDLSLDTPVVKTNVFEKGKVFKDDIVEHFGFPDGSKIPEGYDADGLPLQGTNLKPGSVWLYRYEYNTKEHTTNLTPMRLDTDVHGEVVSVTNDADEIKVVISKYVSLEVGDKMSARHGNKTIIAKVLPQELMPYHPETGRHVDIIINPMAIPTRANFSQIGEMQRTAQVKAEGLDSVVIPPFSGELMKMVEDYGSENTDLTELQLINPQTGLYYPKKHFCGYMHYLRNYKIAEEQLRSVGDSGDMDLAFKQPVGGGMFDEKGQSIPSMEKEILVSLGAEGLLDEIHSVLSSDRVGFKKITKAFAEQPELASIDYDGETSNSSHMIDAFTSFHLSVKQDGDYVSVNYLSDADMANFIQVDPRLIKEDLTSGKYKDTTMYIDLTRPFITPVAVRNFKFTKIIPVCKINERFERTISPLGYISVEGIINTSMSFVVRTEVETYKDAEGEDIEISIPRLVLFLTRQVDEIAREGETVFTGMDDLITYLRKYPMELWIDIVTANPRYMYTATGMYNEKLVQTVSAAKQLVEVGGFERFITTKFPVIPGKYRQSKDEISDSKTISSAYMDISRLAQRLAESPTNYDRLYQRMKLVLLSNSTENKTLFDFWAKKDTGGRIRGKILKTRVLCSMRGTIVPMFADDPAKYGFPEWAGHPDTIGLPLIGAIRISQPRIMGYLKQHHRNLLVNNARENESISKLIDILTLPLDSVRELTGWTENIQRQVNDLKKEIIEFINGSYVFYGRAPSLHETSMRGGRVYVHEEKVIHLNSLLTTDLNADHDGDQIYVAMPLTEKSVNEIKNLLLPSVNVLRYNDGTPSLKINQDSLAGVYFASLAPDTEVPTYVDDAAHARYLLDADMVGLNQLIITRWKGHKIKTTVGRIIIQEAIFGHVNDSVASSYLNLGAHEDGFDDVYYNMEISAANKKTVVAVQADVEKMFDDNKLITNIYSKLQRFGYYCVDKRNLTLGIKDLTPVLNVKKVNKEIKHYVANANTLEELGLLPEDYLIQVDGLAKSLVAKQNIFKNLPDDNALKILVSSGAKGKAPAIEKLFSLMGFPTDSEGKPLPTPILSNLIEGPSQFQIEDLSYTQRVNALSTVKETSKPGETLRSGAFELSGLTIQEPVKTKVPHLVMYSKNFYYQASVGESIQSTEFVDGDFDGTYNGESLTVEYIKALSVKNRNSYIKVDLTNGESTNMYFGDQRLIDVRVGQDYASSVVPESLMDYSFEGQELDEEYVVQLAGGVNGRIQLDDGQYLFFDCQVQPLLRQYFSNKMNSEGNLLTEVEIDDMLKDYPDHVDIATYINEFNHEYGVAQNHAGLRAGSKTPYPLNQNVGIKHSTATGEPASQMVISLRNMDVSDGLQSGIDRFKSAIQGGKFYPDGYTELLAPCDGTVGVEYGPNATEFSLISKDNKFRYTYSLPLEEESKYYVEVKDGQRVRLGQTIFQPITQDGSRRVAPITSFSWHSVNSADFNSWFKDVAINPSTDLIQMVRFYHMNYLSLIYEASGISLDPAHYAGFALQTTRHIRLLVSTDSSLEMKLTNLVKYYNEIEPDKNHTTLAALTLTDGFDTIINTAGSIAAICYRDPINTALKIASQGAVPEFGNLGKVAMGTKISQPFGSKQVIVDKQEGRGREILDLTTSDNSLGLEVISQEEKEEKKGQLASFFSGGGFNFNTDNTTPAEESKEEQPTTTFSFDFNAEPSIFGTPKVEEEKKETTPIDLNRSDYFGDVKEKEKEDKKEEEVAEKKSTDFGTISLFGGDKDDSTT